MKHLLYTITGSRELEDALLSLKSETERFGPVSVLLHFYCGNIKSFSGSDCRSVSDIIIRSAEKILPVAEIIGISGCGEICRADIAPACILLSAFLFRSSTVRILKKENISSCEKEAGEMLLTEAQNCEDVQGVELLFACGSIDSAAIYESLKKCRQWLPFFGGYASEHDREDEPAFLFTKDGIMHDAMAAVFYCGKELYIDAGRTTGWKPLGNTFRITGADGQRLYSVNGIPAYDLYDRFLKFPEEESFSSYAMEFPLMLIRGKMRLLRHPQEKYDDSSILLDGRVKEGDEICLSYGAPVEIIRRINLRCRQIREFEPEAVLIYSCKGRKNFWGDLISWEMDPFQKLAESGGACLDAQVMRNNQTGRVIEHRLTLLSVAMREGEKTGRYIPEIEVDEEILQGRMSLVHRMSTLIESAVEELQKANNELFGMNERLARANDELHRIAITDELTGIYNRREIERRIKESLEKARDEHRKISLVMLDIDFFKKVNDTYGHDVGDMVLKDVSAIIRDNTDESVGEAAGRWGGEEFFVLVPDLDMNGAVALAEKIRKAVEQHDFREVNRLTVSLGVTCADPESNYQAIFIRADQALYEAKQGGRNRVVAK